VKSLWRTVFLLAIILPSITGWPLRAQIVSGAALTFRAVPIKHLFKRGEPIVLVLSIKNNLPVSAFVSSLKEQEFVDISLLGPDGNDVPWKGTGRIESKEYSPAEFVTLKPGETIHASWSISLNHESGFIFTQGGRYRLTAKYSLAPREYFAPLAGSAKIPDGSFSSPASTFCIETCEQASRK